MKKNKKKEGDEGAADPNEYPYETDLPVFNTTNPHKCIPSGASGYTPYQCHVGAEIFTTNYGRFRELDGTGCVTDSGFT